MSGELENIIISNAESLSMAEGSLRLLMYVRDFSSTPVLQESCYAGMSVLKVVNDLILARAILREKKRQGLTDSALHCSRTAVMLSLLRSCELALEVAARAYGGERGRWRAVVAIECLKFMLRLRRFLRLGQRRLLSDQYVTDREVLLSQENRPFLVSAPIPAATATATGGPVRTTHREPAASSGKLAGELLYMTRPLLYLALLWRCGTASWKPWAASALADLASVRLLREERLDGQEKAEVRRRQMLWVTYLLREPMYTWLTSLAPMQALARKLRTLRLLAMILNLAKAYMDGYQPLYFFSSGSS